MFNVHVKPFLDGIWGGLRDPKLHIREASVQALEVRGVVCFWGGGGAQQHTGLCVRMGGGWVSGGQQE